MPFFLNESGDLVGDLPDQLSLDLFEAPNPFENVSLEDRLTAFRAVAKNAKDSFEIALQSLRKLICNCHPVGLLSHFAFYDLTFPYSEKAEYEPTQQHQVEILQALILTIPPAELGTVPPSPDQRLEAKKLTEEIAQAFMLHRVSPEKTAPVDLVREQMRSATQTIRNPGYSDQIEKNIVALFSPLDAKLKELSGITFSGLFKLWKNYSGRVERRYNAILSTFKELRQLSSTEVMLQKFQAETGAPEEIIADFRARVEDDHLTADQLLAGLWNFLEFTHPEIFVSTLDDFVADYEDEVDRTNLAKALDRWSLQMGELHDRRVDHLFLDNPV